MTSEIGASWSQSFARSLKSYEHLVGGFFLDIGLIIYIISLMRYRKPKTFGDSLGQFFTPPDIASLLAAGLKRVPDSLLELGAGRGALVSAVLSRYPRSEATLVELDELLLQQLRGAYPTHHVLGGDVLTQINKLPLAPSYSTVVGNPPFGEFAVTAEDQAALRNLFPGCDRGGWMRQDLAFLHESWNRVAPGGELAILLASPIISDPIFADVRQWLLAEAGYVSVCELPENVFEGAEVGTYLLTIRHRGRGRRTRFVYTDRYLGGGRLQGRIRLSLVAAINRMDYRFHAIRLTAGRHWKKAPSLESLGVQVVRGSRSHGEFVQAGVSHIHTTDFTRDTVHLRLGRHVENGVQLAERGDILVPRVGSRCLLREAVVVSGSRPISDAVFKIRVARQNRTRVFNALASESGRMWRMAHARGSCAKFLTVIDLLQLPVAC